MLGPVRGSRVGRAVAALALGTAALACGDDGADDAACAPLRQFVQLPAEVQPVLDGIVTPAPRLVDVLLRPWSHGDVATQLMVFLHPEHAPDAAAVADDLTPAVDVTDVIGVDEARRQLELLLGPEAAAAQEPTAVLRLLAVGAAEAEQSAAAAAADPRVRTVVSEADAGPYWGRFARTGYDLVAEQLDALEAAGDEELAEGVAALRRHADALAASAGPDLAEWQVPPAFLADVERVVDHVLEECDLYVEDV